MLPHLYQVKLCEMPKCESVSVLGESVEEASQRLPLLLEASQRTKCCTWQQQKRLF